LGNGDKHALRNAGWKAYDAFVSLANEATNLVYTNPAVGLLTGQTIERALQIQHIGSAAASAFFGNLWPALGLPAANEVAALRREITALHEELGEAVAASREDLATAPRFAAAPNQAPGLFRRGYLTRDEREEDEDAAA